VTSGPKEAINDGISMEFEFIYGMEVLGWEGCSYGIHERRVSIFQGIGTDDYGSEIQRLL